MIRTSNYACNTSVGQQNRENSSMQFHRLKQLCQNATSPRKLSFRSNHRLGEQTHNECHTVAATVPDPPHLSVCGTEIHPRWWRIYVTTSRCLSLLHEIIVTLPGPPNLLTHPCREGGEKRGRGRRGFSVVLEECRSKRCSRKGIMQPRYQYGSTKQRYEVHWSGYFFFFFWSLWPC